MPWPMVHFAIADQIAKGDPSPRFLLGSLAPDAIHVRGDVTREEKGSTHFVRDGKLPDNERLRERGFFYLHQNADPEWQSYILGYVAHIYADVRWTNTVYEDFTRQVEGDPRTIRERYNEECGQLEWTLLRTGTVHWQEKGLRRLRQATALAIEPLLTADEVEAYRDTKIAWLSDDRNDSAQELIYLTEAVVRGFIRSTAEELDALFRAWGIDEQILSLHRS